MKAPITGGGIGGLATLRSPRSVRSTQLQRWYARCSARFWQRQALAQLDDRDLKDIGVTRQQANVEAAKPFWK
jgi:uncharacterized protein YjiS (DUF1127 family)